MKPNSFNYTLLAVGVAAAMGVGVANAAAPTTEVNKGDSIENIATATYEVDGVKQPEVISNKVIVSTSDLIKFSLVATQGSDSADEKNEGQEAVPGGTTNFKHTLTNLGNVNDTYTINITDNDDPTIDTNGDGNGANDKDYAFTNQNPINYVIKQQGGGELTAEQKAALSTLGQSESDTINSGGTIQLLPGLEAQLNFDATTPSAQAGGDSGVGTLEATSTKITTEDSTKATLINENQAIVKVPVFKIVKTAACQGNTTCNNFNLNATDNTITYTIKITNVDVTGGYAKDATNFTVRDVLPAGMALTGSVTAPSGTNVTSTGTDASGRQIIDVTGANLAVGAEIEISFKVTVDKANLDPANTDNHATVYDNHDGSNPDPNGTPDVTDSTDSTDSNNPEDQPGEEGEDTATNPTFSDRSLSISPGTEKEVPITDGEASYEHTITNNGNAAEGGTDRPITITITDPNTKEPLQIKGTPTYTLPDGTTGNLVVVDATAGTYKLPDTVIIPKSDGDETNDSDTVKINYTVETNGATNANIGDSDTNSIKVEAGEDGGITPAPATAENKTTIQGMTLLKEAALDQACNGTIDYTYTDKPNTWGTGINAQPGDCIKYRITATNTFTTKDLTNVVISDLTDQWKAHATYQQHGITSTGVSSAIANPGAANEAVSATIDTIAKKTSPTNDDDNSENLIFSIKINAN